MYALIFQVCVFIPILVGAVVRDATGRRKSYFPHKEQKSRMSKQCWLCLYSFLYNSPVLNIWSYKSIIILCFYKAVYLSAVMWFVLILLHIPFSQQLQNPTLATYLLPLLFGFFLISQSIVLWSVTKNIQTNSPKQDHSVSQEELKQEESKLPVYNLQIVPRI